MIFVENVTKEYKIQSLVIKAVDNVSIEIKKGDFLLITGRSGSGKTTLLSLIGGLTKPTSGRILFENIDIWSLSDQDLSQLRNKKMGFIFQFFSLIPSLSVKENLRLPTLFNKDDIDFNRRCNELLETVGLSYKISSYPLQLSGGEQRRIAFTRSLINSPKYLFADEPTGDLDEETEKEMMVELRKLNENGLTIILVTHNIELKKYTSNHFKMVQGKIFVD
jgi:putative ABC transport system ATP-binding protein/lipoprotein-releasing system ATP-binding protein